eukprot:GFKZ01013736.1.p2 GENE.GFKZ01013736.1~~GFKZ01013736.1.p2  ORF type:complete len:122 (+),score=2.13 GFKZ01013736.1:1247-1612(+)
MLSLLLAQWRHPDSRRGGTNLAATQNVRSWFMTLGPAPPFIPTKDVAVAQISNCSSTLQLPDSSVSTTRPRQVRSRIPTIMLREAALGTSLVRRRRRRSPVRTVPGTSCRYRLLVTQYLTP